MKAETVESQYFKESDSDLIDMRGIEKTYDVSPPVHVLRNLALRVTHGEKVAIVGQSGVGKSTLLNIVGLLDNASAGTYILAGEDTAHLKPRERDRLRSQVLGFVFQDYHVLGHRTVSENLDIKLSINQVPRHERGEKIARVLHTVGLTDRENSPARLLSGGEKQRLAIARAVICEPQIILADEPTGNLDSLNREAILEILDEQVAQGVAVVVITHDEHLAQWAQRVETLAEGRLWLRSDVRATREEGICCV